MFPNPTMSAHFAVLREAGLVEPIKKGRVITYHLMMSVLEEAMFGFAQVFGLEVKAVDQSVGQSVNKNADTNKNNEPTTPLAGDSIMMNPKTQTIVATTIIALTSSMGIALIPTKPGTSAAVLITLAMLVIAWNATKALIKRKKPEARLGDIQSPSRDTLRHHPREFAPSGRDDHDRCKAARTPRWRCHQADHRHQHRAHARRPLATTCPRRTKPRRTNADAHPNLHRAP